MTRYEAFTERSGQITGLTQLLVARIRADGRTEVAFFLIDLWCLGVKDAFLYEDETEASFRELLIERLPEEFRQPIHPACAKKMIDGAIAYAERLGFAPHRDYRKARRALSGLDAAACPETYTFGRDGRPCYVEGPNDTPERTERVLAMLEARLGADGFDYELADDGDDETEAGLDAREALQAFFANEPGGPDFHEFAGMVAALHVCPRVVPPTQVLARLWEPGGRVWRDEAEAQEFGENLRDYWNYVGGHIAHCATAAEDDLEANPIDLFTEDFEAAEEAGTERLFVDGLVAWNRGFLRATTEWPEAWGDALERPDLAPHWAHIRAWADPEAPASAALLADDEQAMADENRLDPLPAAVVALIRALRPSAPGFGAP